MPARPRATQGALRRERTSVTVYLDAALVRDLRQALGMVGDPFAVPPSTPKQRRLQQDERNRFAVEIAIRQYLKGAVLRDTL